MVLLGGQIVMHFLPAHLHDENNTYDQDYQTKAILALEEALFFLCGPHCSAYALHPQVTEEV